MLEANAERVFEQGNHSRKGEEDLWDCFLDYLQTDGCFNASEILAPVLLPSHPF